MISEESAELIGILLSTAMNKAADQREYDRFERYSQARYEYFTDLDDRRRTEHTDQTLVEETIRRHAAEMLKLSTHRPQARELFPAEPFAQAQWHLLRIEALRATPVDVAAAHLREEALTALTPKEPQP